MILKLQNILKVAVRLQYDEVSGALELASFRYYRKQLRAPKQLR